ncbi:MAG: thioredoxin domain-containing protein [Candidatus Solibacter usitatus]|nr:thioredoxin domain-containing protein [Candidatus Solibacter usitatus]
MSTNRLIHEKSPYLLQHAHNPVDWRPWGEEAFRKAREEDKPIFLSAGYSTCHWCHVMERESFEDPRLAALLNRHFVPVKLDREERPDIDRVYMLYVQATTGSGGWPMSVWLTPELKPFYGGTYFPPDNRYGRPGFGYVLEQLAAAWRNQRANLIDSSLAVLAELERHSALDPGTDVPAAGAIESCFHHFRQSFDSRYAGFGDAPKFPRPSVLNFLFRYHHRTGNAEARDMALATLRAMAAGGMNDQLGGGFHRYSVDQRWLVPHFEKMLYDQAQLAASFLEAFQITRDRQYAHAARRIFDYVLRDMTHPDGGFNSAEDADSVIDPANPHEKGEGAFYVWTHGEIVDVLGPVHGPQFAAAFGCRESGNVDHDPHGEFSGRNILHDAGGRAREFDDCLPPLLAARARRVRPHLDDKILTSWNALMISALARGGVALDEPRYLAAALNACAFIERELHPRGRLMRRWRDGEAAIDAFLDDYAALCLARVDLFEATLDHSHLDAARTLALRMIELFEDKRDGGFFSAAAGQYDLVLRLKEDYDGAEPCGNSLAAAALLRLAACTGLQLFREAAENIFKAFAARLSRQSPTLPQMLGAYMESVAPKSELRLSGDSAGLLAEFRRGFRPFTTITTGEPGANAAVLCENFVCLPAASSREELRELLK